MKKTSHNYSIKHTSTSIQPNAGWGKVYRAAIIKPRGFNVSDADYEFLKSLANGNASEGLRRVVNFYRENKEKL